MNLLIARHNQSRKWSFVSIQIRVAGLLKVQYKYSLLQNKHHFNFKSSSRMKSFVCLFAVINLIAIAQAGGPSIEIPSIKEREKGKTKDTKSKLKLM
jgi:hypothetical protein